MEIQWSLVLFTALTGTAGWMTVCVALDEFVHKTKDTGFVTSLVALIIAIAGGIASVTHLSHPDRMLNALQHPTSGIFVEAVLTGCLVVFLIIFMILAIRKASPGARKVFAIIAAIFGVVLSFMAGQSYMMEARANWDTFLLPLGYLGTVIPAGIGAYLTVVGATKRLKDVKPYANFLIIGGVVAIITVCLYVLIETTLDGATGALFALALIGSGVVPLVLGFILRNRTNSALAIGVVTLICSLAGAIAFRCIMWMITDAVNLFQVVI